MTYPFNYYLDFVITLHCLSADYDTHAYNNLILIPVNIHTHCSQGNAVLGYRQCILHIILGKLKMLIVLRTSKTICFEDIEVRFQIICRELIKYLEVYSSELEEQK